MKLLFTCLCFFLSSYLFSQTQDVSKIRNAYLASLKENNKDELNLKYLLSLDEKSALHTAYKGVAYALSAKLSKGVWDKYSLITKSYNMLNDAVAKSENDVEIRFLRYSVCSQLPSFLGMGKNSKLDYEFLMKSIHGWSSDMSYKNIMISFLEKNPY